MCVLLQGSGVHVSALFCCFLCSRLFKVLLPFNALRRSASVPDSHFRRIDSFQNQSGFSGRHRGGTLDPAAVRTANLGISVLHPNTLWGLAEAP